MVYSIAYRLCVLGSDPYTSWPASFTQYIADVLCVVNTPPFPAGKSRVEAVVQQQETGGRASPGVVTAAPAHGGL